MPQKKANESDRCSNNKMSVPKLDDFCRACLEKGIVSPTEMKTIYERAFPHVTPKTLEAYIMAIKRFNLRRLEEILVQTKINEAIDSYFKWREKNPRPKARKHS